MRRLLAASVFLAAVTGPPAWCAEIPTFQQAAARLRAATVTIRIVPPEVPSGKAAGDAEADDDLAARPAASTPSVTICSGVSLGRGLLVTHLPASRLGRLRLTAPGGDQGEAQLRVVDHYSGLTLLESSLRNQAGLELADESPVAGAWIVSGAAWGVEEPVVSVGVLSGAKRSIPGTRFPPLLQCDVRPAETSSGGAVVDREGRLIGIIVATDATDRRQNWTYAVPVDHVRRLLRARVDGKLVVLRRRRPVVGLVLGAGDVPETVVVQRVVRGGPAEKAGLQVGDHILAADEIKIRSVYQALRPLLQKQPGDTLTLRVGDEEASRQVEITLGGGIELPADAAATSGRLVDRRIEVNRVGPGRFDVVHSPTGVRNLGYDTATPPAAAPADRDATQLLQTALQRYGQLIVQLQQQLKTREAEQAQLLQQVQALQSEIATLRQQLQQAETQAGDTAE